ncbi:MAG: dUTP diphosphatase [Bowdeniella nasicola]|nr:dUTP diphosphatase [Bowdeniella nasicola]
MESLPVQRLVPTAQLPARAHRGDAGADLCTTIDLVLEPHARVLAPTGIAVAIPHGYVGLIHPRSGLAYRQGLTVLNTPGTIDAGYRGEIRVLLYNADSGTTIRLAAGERIAQLVIVPVALPSFHEVSTLDQTDRGSGGFGSTGMTMEESARR